jgi:tetratricopeptide (TPR) repeat protein
MIIIICKPWQTNCLKRKRKEMESTNSKKITGRLGESGIKSVKKLYNPFNPLLKITVLLLIFILSFSALILISGCKSKAASESIAAAADSESASNAAESAAAASTAVSGSGSSSSTTTSASTTAATTTKQTTAETATESATESTEAIPSEITALITKADGYYTSGQYGLSKSTYRKAIIAIDASDLSDVASQELKDTFNDKYNKSKNIVETALVHFGNAMQLQYETRYEEAKTELEAALAIYPKYEDAIEAYDNLKSIMGLG